MRRTVLAAVDDMFFASKIRATAEAVGVDISFVRTKDAILQKARQQRPDLVLLDLHNQKLDAVELARELKADAELQTVPLLGFCSHVETELQRKALAAGYDRVLARSVFSRDLGEILGGS